MKYEFSFQSNFSVQQAGTTKKLKKRKSKAKNQNLPNDQKISLLSQNEFKYIFELTCSKDRQKTQQIQQQKPTKICFHIMGQLERDVFSDFFKFISIQQQKYELIVRCVPFSKTSLFNIKKNFPFYINLDQVSTNFYSFDSQKTLENVKQKEVPEEKFEFIINTNQDIIGCNRIVNNSWLKMFGINQDMMIHHLLRNQSFPFGWDLENQFIQNQVSNTFTHQKLRVQLVSYNGLKFNAEMFVRSEIETNSKKQFIQRYIISYTINREQLSLQQVEQNFRQYFYLKDLTQELRGKFIEKSNKPCQIRRL